MADKCHLAKFVYADLSLVIRIALLFPVWEAGTFMPCVWADSGGQRAPPVSTLSLLLSAQNNPYDQGAYFWVAYSDPLPAKEWGGKCFAGLGRVLREDLVSRTTSE